MLRATITKFKRAYALAGVPRILRGDFQIPPCNFDKISAIFMKSKSTTSGSKHEEDEKCKKCKQLIELAFGPERTTAEEGFEKVEVANIPELLETQAAHKATNPGTICEKDDRIAGTAVTMSKQLDNDDFMPNIIKETKIGDEGKIEVIKEPPLFQSFKRNKEMHGDGSTPVLLSKNDAKKPHSGDINMLEILAKQTNNTMDKQVLEEIEKLGISQQLLKDIANNSFGNVDGLPDKFKKDIRNPDKISEIDLDTRVLEKDQTKMSGRKFINRRAIKHLALHMGAEDISKNITSNDSSKKGDNGPNNKLSDDKYFKIEHKAPLNRRKPSERKRKVKLEKVLTSSILTDDRHLRRDNEVPLDSRIRTPHDTLSSSDMLPENKRCFQNRYNRTSPALSLDSGKSLEHDRFIDREAFPQIAKEKVKLGNENINLHKEPAIATDENDNNEPAVLVKECQDPGNFRITPETPRAETLTDQLIALNLKIQAAIAANQTFEVSELKEKEEILTKEAARQKITNEVEKLFKDDRMPRHLFAHLTVVSRDSSKRSGADKIVEPSAFNTPEKITYDRRVPPHMFNGLTVLARNLPKEGQLKKVIQDFYEQEHDPELIKPDRMLYNSPNDDIVEDKDYSLELDPRVVIRENFTMKEPTLTSPPIQPRPPQLPQTPNYYSNYYHNQGNMPQENMQPQNPYMPQQNPYVPEQQPYMPHQNPYMPRQNPYNMPSQNPWGGPHMHFYDNTMASSAVMPVDGSPSTVMPVNENDEMPQEKNTMVETQQKLDATHDNIQISEHSRDIKITEDIHNSEPTREIKAEVTQVKLAPNDGISLPYDKRAQVRELDTPEEDNIRLTHNKKPHVANTLTASDGKLIKNMSTANVNATSAVQDKTKITPSSNKFNHEDSDGPNSEDSAVTRSGNIKDSFENNLPNKVITKKASTDQNLGNLKTYFKSSQPSSTSHVGIPKLKLEPGRVKVKIGSLDTPVKMRSDWRKLVSYSKDKPDIKPKKHASLQSKVRLNPWINKAKVAMKPKTAISEVIPQVPEKPQYGPDIQDKKTSLGINPNMTLAEMLRKVRQRARLEMLQQIVLAAPAPKVKPTQGSCKDPKPPCPPPQKTCPSSEPKKCPPPQCPPKPKPAPKPCKPACPDPCATPKCPPAPKKDPCAKCNKTDNDTDIFGLVVSLGPMGMSKVSTINYLFMEDMSLCGTLPDNLSLTKLEDPLIETVKDLEDDISVPDLFHNTLMFPKNYEPWTPIPSWPIPRKVEKKKLVCPKDGCRIRGPPPPGAPCDTIHHPCSGFPNDKKRT